ncbi:protein kinase [Streptomyces canus]|uniref:serine/threonine-protein kinase n=1 Tax=Streptomyces canus TaxID=58343 RepID=UPI00368A87FA
MGEVFAGRYELADPIGRGGVGAVWRAWDHRRRRYVAAKVLLQSDAHSLLRFVREQALRIDHPHVLAPASWAADDDKVLFTMDLVAGGSLVHLVGDYGPLPPVFVCTLLDQLLAGLAAVHAEGVVHRDIKPANILLEATGTARPRLRLSDFGIAMRLGEPRLTETNLVVGTPGYLAPEQMMGAEPDFPADLFAVGLVALYLLEGAKPDAKALIEYFAAHGTPGAPQSVPEPLWQVVASLLQPDPQARFRTATGARKALAAARELLPEPGPDDESIEIFDQLGPVPPGFGPEGPLKRAPGVDPNRTRSGVSGAGGDPRFGTSDGLGSFGGGAGGEPSGVGGGSGTPSGGGGSTGGFAVRGGDGTADWRGVGTGPGAGVASGASTGPSAGGGSGAGSGAGVGFGAGPDVASGAGEADVSSSWPGQVYNETSRPGAGNAGGGASSWFGEGNGVSSGAGSQPREAEGSPFRPGEGNGPASSQPREADGAPYWPGEGNGPVSSQPGEAEGSPFRPGEGVGWSSQPGVPGRVPSWHGGESGIPHRPREASDAANQRGGTKGAPYPHGEANDSVHELGETNGPVSRPGEDSESPWLGHRSAAPWPSEGNDPARPGEYRESPRPGERSESPPPGERSATPWPTHHTPPAPTQPPSVSDTGSFHLPPPRPADSRSQPSTPPEHQAQPHHHHPQAQGQPYRPAPSHSAYVSPHDPTPPTHVLPSPQPHAPRFPTQAPTPVPYQPHADASTASYTAQSPQVPPRAPSLSRARRTGPPAKVALPLLLLALACYAVGFWALTQI